MKVIPKGLIYLRLLIGVFILIFSFTDVEHFNTIAAVLFSIGFLSDIFDGIIARQLNISSQHLRRLDSGVDQAFWLMVITALFIKYPDFYFDHALAIIVLIILEAATYLLSFIRFRKEVATHALSSKLWAINLFITLLDVFINGNAHVFFAITFYLGIATRCEIIAILLILRTWTNDVPSVYHAVQLRKGRNIKRSKLFNG